MARVAIPILRRECPDAKIMLGYDPLNGTLQELRSKSDGERTRIGGVLVRDCPLLLRLSLPAAD